MTTALRTIYTRAEQVSDAIVHLTGLTLVLMAVPVLIVLTALYRGDAASITGVSVYGGALIAMILFSALYNIGETSGFGAAKEWLLRRLDHSAIYLKIAGTYTPFTLLSGHGVAMTVGVWFAALAGIALKIVSPEKFKWAALALYLGMGWVGVVLGGPMFAALPTPVLVLMAVGGGLYTLGVVFYLWRRLPFHYTIWHVFVLAASFVFYSAVLVFVLLGPQSVLA
ncbi:hemolysin III family protein [Rhodobacter sp. NTK016B]|uniref:PAQR family membrane homeostasis protein TrhA n=1 Tax=Rhodobacter sp. NTK016B TaxID=2759676 RepID=UPI001A8D6A94|nr:hemolysin III family protein [Rhodobacter sp. NTK016B]MBN8293073.1 hemolysin III family protein [Rhodobacter sp. NTK016B]